MNYRLVAARLVEARRRRTRDVSRSEDVLVPSTEYSCRMEVSFSADFEGDVAQRDLVKKVKTEVMAAMKSAMKQVARDLGLTSTGLTVQPLQVECAVNDQMSVEDEPDEPVRKRRRGR